MNLMYPDRDFASDTAAIDGFAKLIKAGFQNPEGLLGTVKLNIPEYPDQSLIAHFGQELRIVQDDLDAGVDAVVSIPIKTIKRIFHEFEYLDFRDPSIIGTVEFSGSLDLANHLGRSCLRPSKFTLDRFKEVGTLHREKDYRNLDRVERVHRPSQMEVLEAMEQSRPLIITGLEPSPPCRDWTIERLAKQYPTSIVRVLSATKKQTMQDFVQELKDFMTNPTGLDAEGSVKPYTEGAGLPEEMWADFGPLFFDREDFIPPQLWLGAVPTHIPTSSLHRDPHCGFLLQVIGRKRLDLYSADQEEALYPHTAYNNYQPCWFKPENPNYTIYPKAKTARCISVTLNPGELIVQPAGWFHQVHALDSPNMSVSYFWRY